MRNSNTINSGDFNAPITSVHRPSRQKTHKENTGFRWYIRSHRCNRQTYNIPYKSNRIHILKGTRNIPQVTFLATRQVVCFFFFFCTTSHGSWDLSSGPGNKPGSSEVKVWLPNHWTTRNFAKQVLINLMRLNAIKHLSHPWWYENRSQLQEENWESDRCGAENHLLLNSWWFREEIRREVKQDFQRNGKGNTAHQTHRAQQRQLSEGLCVYA